jgi:hypothetical protein
MAAVSMTTQAADSTLTLACQGTATLERVPQADPEPISMGIIVNFAARTVTGFTHPTEKFPLTIESFNDVMVHFRGSDALGSLIIYGTIDRVTGDVEATSITKTFATNVKTYSLKCRPAQRMF